MCVCVCVLTQCVAEVKAVFAAVEAALLMGNETEVGKDFGCCETPLKPEDKAELLQSLADIFMGTVQYNEEGVAFSIAELCDIMTNKSEACEQEAAYDRLVKIVAVTFLHLILCGIQTIWFKEKMELCVALIKKSNKLKLSLDVF